MLKCSSTIVAMFLMFGLLGNTLAGPAPYLELYSGTGASGSMYAITGAHHDFDTEGFNDLTRSVCGIGVWFLYEDRDFLTTSAFVVTFQAYVYTCMDLDVSQYDAVSSVRYAGADDIDYPTLTLYKEPSQCGEQHISFADEDSLLGFNDEASSFVVVGAESWTVYHDAGYLGGGFCLVPTLTTDGLYYGIWDQSEVSVGNDQVSSIRKGCFTNRIYKYNAESRTLEDN